MKRLWGGFGARSTGQARYTPAPYGRNIPIHFRRGASRGGFAFA